MKFTDRSVQALKPQAKRYIVWKDGGGGLGLRVSPKGRKTFIYMYRFGGRARMMTLGDYPKVDLSEANLAHSQAADDLKHGKDPGANKVAERKAERMAETVKELADEYLEKWAKPRKRTWRKDYLILEKDILPEWGRSKAKDITRRDVILLLDKILKRNAPIQANRTLAVIRKMYNFALSRDIVETSPCVGVNAPAPEMQRDRILSEKEIKHFWEKLEDADMHKATRIALKLMLATAQRAGEVSSIKWTDLDEDNGWWTIPAENAKNKLPHRVPLSPLALELIEKAKPLAGNSDYVFRSPRDGKHKHVDPHALAQAIYRNEEHFGFEDKIVPHDLRRTAASHITGMGISRLVVSKILNHVESGITAVYDRHSYDAEKRHALGVWAKKLSEILAGKQKQTDKVVALHS